MACWKYRIEFGDFWGDYPDKKSIDEMGKLCAIRIRGSNAYNSEEKKFLERLAKRFERVDDVKKFDRIYHSLCDWGDEEVAPYGAWPINKMAWINVFKVHKSGGGL